MALARNLIDMETEFRIMNQELESKTVELMKRAEDVVKCQENAVYDFISPENEGDNTLRNQFYKMDEIDKAPEDNVMQYCWYSDDSQNKLKSRQETARSTKNIFSPTLRRYNSPSSDQYGNQPIRILNNKKMINKRQHVDSLLAIKDRIKGQSMFPDITKPERCGSMPNLKDISNNGTNEWDILGIRVNDALQDSVDDFTFDINDFEGNINFKCDADNDIVDDDKTDDEDDNIERIMKALEDQKSFNKTLDNLMKRKDSIRNNGAKDSNRAKFSMPYSNLNTSVLYTNKKERVIPIIRIQEESDIEAEKEINNLYNHKGGRTANDDAVIKALREKIKTLQEELQKCNETLKKKSSECSDASKINQGLEESKVKLTSQINTLKTTSTKQDGKISALASKLQTKEAECRALRTERDNLSKAVKDSGQSNSGAEARLNRAREEVHSLREALATLKQQEKDLRESTKKQVDELTHELTNSEKRGKSAVTAVKKQSQLIDNLKRQINLLTVSEEVKKSEGQLDSILKWQHK